MKNNTGRMSIRIEPIIEQIENVDIQTGTGFRIVANSECLDDAVAYAEEILEFFINAFSFVSRVGLVSPTLMIAYESTPNIEQRTFIQFFDYSIISRVSRRTINPGYLSKTFTLTTSYKENEDRITRSLNWFRLALQSRDGLTSFICIWTALENLEPILRVRYGIEPKNRVCPKCKNELPSIEKTDGIRSFLETRFPEHENLYWQLNDLRNEILHGKTSLKVLKERVNSFQKEIDESYIEVIHALAGINENVDILAVRNEGMRVKLEACIEGFEQSEDDKTKGCPSFSLSDIKFNPTKVGDSITFNIVARTSHTFPSNVKVTIKGFGAKSQDADITINKCSISRDKPSGIFLIRGGFLFKVCHLNSLVKPGSRNLMNTMNLARNPD